MSASEKQSDTPRTDAAIVSAEYIRSEMDYYEHKFVLADVARQLERELTAARAEAEALRKDAERWREYDERKRKVIAAGQGKKILRDAAIDAARSERGKE